MHDMNDVILEPLSENRGEDHSAKESALQAHYKLDSLLGRQEELEKVGSMPSAPPSYVLNAMIDSYFATVNPYLPMWTKEQFCQLTVASQEDSAFLDQDRAYSICSNNLILMTLTAKSFRSRSYNPGRPRPLARNHLLIMNLLKHS